MRTPNGLKFASELLAMFVLAFLALRPSGADGIQGGSVIDQVIELSLIYINLKDENCSYGFVGLYWNAFF